MDIIPYIFTWILLGAGVGFVRALLCPHGYYAPWAPKGLLTIALGPLGFLVPKNKG